MRRDFKKKCLAWVTTAVLALASVPVAGMSGVVLAAVDGDITVIINDIEYTISNGEAAVTSGKDARGDVVIPDTITYNAEEYNVTSIAEEAFRYNYQGNTNIVSVSIGDNVISIGEYAFGGCTSLESVTFGARLTSLDRGAFNNCGLKSIDIPAGVTEIPQNAFSFNRALESVTFRGLLTQIGESAFLQCTSLKSIELPESVTYIGQYVFSDCEQLESIKLPNGLTNIEMFTFSNCRAMTSISIPKSVSYIGEMAFEECRSLTNITIPCDFEKDMFSSEMKGQGSGILPSEEDTYKIVPQMYYQMSYIPEEELAQLVIGTGTFTYTHDIEYSADGNTITAACSNNDVNAGSVTLVAPDDKTYTGSAVEATYTGSFDSAYVTETPAITYIAKDGSALTDGKPVEVGSYTASITFGGKTVSVDYDIEAVVTEPEGDGEPAEISVDKSADVAEDAPVKDASLDNETSDLKSLLSDADIAKVESGKTAQIFVKITQTTPAAEAETKIKKAAKEEIGDSVTIKYMDVSLFKQIGDEAAEQITEPGMKIKITLDMPDELLNTNNKEVRKYRIIKLHDGDTEVIQGIFDEETKKFTFETDQFSTYAIAYEDEKKDISLGDTKTEQEITKIGSTIKLNPTVTPATDADQSVVYESDNTAVATVDVDGNVVAVGNGTANIKISTPDGAVSKTIKITVNDTSTSENPTTAPSGDDDDTDLTDDAAETSSTGTLVASENKGNTSTGAANATNTTNSASADVGASSPKTADTANVPAMAALMALAGMLVCLAMKTWRKSRIYAEKIK